VVYVVYLNLGANLL